MLVNYLVYNVYRMPKCHVKSIPSNIYDMFTFLFNVYRINSY